MQGVCRGFDGFLRSLYWEADMQTTANTTVSRLMHLSGNKTAGMRLSRPEAHGRPGSESPVRIGLALGGGFARGIAHAGVLRVLEQHHIPIHCVTGISAGSIVAAAYASGASTEEIVRAGCSMRLGDVGRFRPGRLGLIGSQAMKGFLERLLKAYRFEEMRIPLGVLATDLATGEPAPFAGTGEVFEPIRASCAYPGLFQPVSHQGRLLVDGVMSMGIPAALARQLGATHVISVSLPPAAPGAAPNNMFQVVSRCFQILQSRCENSWRCETDLEIAPDVRRVDWNAFGRGPELVQAGEAAARASLPKIREWLSRPAATPASFLQMEMAY
jgi:NTE family protein